MTTHRSDIDIKKDILLELRWDPEVKETDIGVIVKDGAVTLTGKVPLFSHKYAATRASKRVKGVRAIVDEIEVKLPREMEGSDEGIAQHIARTFEWNVQIPADDIEAEVKNGVVTLSGEVERHYQRSYIQRQIEDTKGVRSVINNIRIRKLTTVSDVKGEIVKALHRHANVEAGRVQVAVANGTVTLSGTVDSYWEKDLIKNAAWKMAGVTRVVDNMMINDLFAEAA